MELGGVLGCILRVRSSGRSACIWYPAGVTRYLRILKGGPIWY